MPRPNMQWKGSAEVMHGEAILTTGEMRETVVLGSCADAMKIQRLMDKAYIDGARDALHSMRLTVEHSMGECVKRW